MTIDRLRELFSYDPSTGIFTNKITRGRAKVGKAAGTPNADGYLRVKADYSEYYLHRLAWLHETGELPEDQIDHRNGDKSDNRFINLRLSDNSQNCCNKPKQANNTSGFKGVSLHRQSGLWFAYAQRYGKRVSGGYHKTASDAAIAAAQLRRTLHDQFVNHGYRKLTRERLVELTKDEPAADAILRGYGL